MYNPRTVRAFGPFRWLPEQRALYRSETLLPLGSRARGILSVLIDRPGQVVKRSEIVALVWGGCIIEEGTLRTHIAWLRKALECEQPNVRYIETVNGIGYRFNGSVECDTESLEPTQSDSQASLSPTPTRMIGREGIVTALLQRLHESRLLTIVGPGGIGKTTVANTAMTLLRGEHADGACLVDLSTISDERLVAATLMEALNASVDKAAPSRTLIDRLADRQLLLVLDNCEHVIDAVAPLAEALLLRAKHIRILATSREPLRVQGESILRLPPLDVPPRAHCRSAQEVLKYSAVRLFIEHATSNDHTFELMDIDAPLAAEICRRLDGLPLALELAAAKVSMFGLHGLAAHLDQSLNLLTHGRRTAPPRHRTLRATLQWSFNLLSDIERRALHRLSTMADSFDLNAARAAVADDGIDGNEVINIVSSLTSKSLVVVDSGEAGLFRLLETTRKFALSEMRS